MRNFILENFKIKIVVIVIAIFVWFFVKTENNYKHSFKIPTTISNLGEDKIIITDIPSHVKVTLHGKGHQLLSLLLNQKLQYNFDLINENKGRIFKLNKNNVFPRISNVEILKIVAPDSVFIGIENLQRKKVPIIANINVIPESGYTIVNGIQLDSTEVLIEGAESFVDSVTEIRTEQLIFKKVKRDLQKKVKLIRPKVNHVWLTRNNVHLFVDIQKLLEKPLVEIPVQVINEPRNVELTVIPSTLSLTLIGGVDLLLPLTNKDISAYIDYKRIQDLSEKYYLAYIEKPDGVRIKDVKPKHFKIIKKKKY